ncbi:MAG: RNA recognition motif domain-containing protein [Chromatiales bacterium]
MAKSIYVGNLAPSITQEEIRKLFEEFGEVESVEILMDRYTGESRGFGFVKMPEKGAQAAIAALDKKLVGDRNLKVNEATPRKLSGGSRPRGGAFGNGGGGRRRY